MTGSAAWRVLVVDDDPEVHAVTRLALSDFEFEGRGLELLTASSDAEAREVIRSHDDVGLILLDVVMETDHAGLDTVHYVREELKDSCVRIVLRTGQPGQAPAREVISRYEIDDYRTKTELTFERLNVLVTTALRTYNLLRQMDQRRSALQASNEELERFAYVASHDLQTPLRSIASFTKLLNDRCGAQLDERGRELLGFIVGGARELQALISDLLEYSRVGRATEEPEPVNLNSVVVAAIAKLRTALDERHVRMDIGRLPRIMGRATQLEQLFRNLIDNAVKFQPDEDPVVHVTAQDAGESWEVSVRDEGIGIERDFLSYIFDPFRRLHTQEQFPGSGIGLAICKRVVTAHGGTIRAESEPGKGTTIVLTFPKIRSQPNEAGEDDQIPVAGDAA